MSGARVLYLTYDGLTDPLGESQVLPYLERLAVRGHKITIISCEKPQARAVRGAAVAAQCAAAGIEWHPLRYRKRPPVLSTLIDLAGMRQTARALHRAQSFDLIHCRSYLPGLIGLEMKQRTGVRFLFDMRGFWIDERFERGIWDSGSPIFGVIAGWLRKRERVMFDESDAVVSLTNAAREALGRRGGAEWVEKTSVVPCCADLAHFDPRGGAMRRSGRALLGIGEDAPVALFLGSLGGAYPLEPVANFFKRWSAGRNDARLLAVTRHAEAEVRSDPALAALGRRLVVRAGERKEMPALIAAADVGLSFILPSSCAVASSPTKVGEMLAMGVPVVANAGVGDISLIMSEQNAGALLPDLSSASIKAAADTMNAVNGRESERRAVAERWFSLESGVATYDRLYHHLTGC
jgi:glycosyltransferase involved in cell wall biosynthesis